MSFALHNNNNAENFLLISKKGFIPIGETNISKGYFIMSCNKQRGNNTIDAYNQRSFHIKECTHVTDNNIVCDKYAKMTKVVRDTP